MFETHYSQRINEAQQIAHKERAAIFAHIFGSLPRLMTRLANPVRTVMLGQKVYKLG